MDTFILFTILPSLLLLTTAWDAHQCKPAKCRLHSPEVRSPFRIPNLQPQQCGLPGFDLFCRENRTMIHFQSYGDLEVKSISYDTKRLQLIDPKSCVPEVFLNLNLSLTAFSYYYVLKEYKYINCSSEISTFSTHVPCLSSPAYHVYVVESSYAIPASCHSAKTVKIPFSYSPFLNDDSFGLRLTWEFTEYKDYEDGKKGHQVLNFQVLVAILLISMMVALFYAILAHGKELCWKNGVETRGAKLQGDYAALN